MKTQVLSPIELAKEFVDFVENEPVVMECMEDGDEFYYYEIDAEMVEAMVAYFKEIIALGDLAKKVSVD